MHLLLLYKFHMLHLVQVAPCPAMCSSGKSLAPSSVSPLSRQLKRAATSRHCQPLQQPNNPSLPISPYPLWAAAPTYPVALYWAWSSVAMSFLYWGALNWTQCSKCGLTEGKTEEESLPWTCCAGTLALAKWVWLSKPSHVSFTNPALQTGLALALLPSAYPSVLSQP